MPRWSRGTRDHRRPARPRPARPAVATAARGVARGPPRRPAPRHLAARRALRAARPAACSPSRRSRPTSPGREYDLLRSLRPAATCPASSRSASSAAAIGLDGEPLDACLITRHLQFSLPYRALFSQTLRPDTAARLIDALAVLLVRLHLAGLLVGRRVAVEHAVPARRRRVRRLPRRRRDRRAARRGSATASASTTSRSPGSTSPAS